MDNARISIDSLGRRRRRSAAKRRRGRQGTPEAFVSCGVPHPAAVDPSRWKRSWETFLYWTPCVHSHVGYGIDNPEDADLGLGQRSRNSTYFANLMWDVNSSFRVALEYTYRETEYNLANPIANQGSGYHAQLRWSY